MSRVMEILEEAKSLPEPEKQELVDRLIALKSIGPQGAGAPYRVQPLPLGIRTDKLPSHILEEMEAEQLLLLPAGPSGDGHS